MGTYEATIGQRRSVLLFGHKEHWTDGLKVKEALKIQELLRFLSMGCSFFER